ncbi:hypothetical protein THASP1DRAFT_3660, partial [Thamnocephalis sphaerospora]
SGCAGFTCEAYQQLPEDERDAEDLQTLRLIKSNQWQRCPDCRVAVERTHGCPRIQCRCGAQFCYRCSSKWDMKLYKCTGYC